MAKGFRAILLAAGIVGMTAAAAHAQAIGSIFGKVTDASGAVLPGVTVTVTGTGLQQPLVGTTSENGTYQFPSVPVGTYTVAFELASFKKGVRQNIVITAGFNAGVDQKLEIGQMSEEVTISAASPVVDTKKTTTGATFTAEILEKIPTARDVQQILNMTPGVQLNGYNVGGSSSGQQLTPSSRGTTAQVQWNLEGGLITDLSSNSSALYYNFDSFDQIQVTSGGGDVSVQASGLSINLVTKSGSNIFKGSFNATFENDSMQAGNVTEELFNAGGNGFLSGNPLHKIAVYSVEAGGPIKKDKLWFWGAYDRQDINVGITNFFDPAGGQFCQDLITAQRNSQLSGKISYDQLDQVTGCLKNDKTLITDLNAKVNYQLSQKNKLGFLLVTDNKYRNARGASATTLLEAATQQTSPQRFGMHYPTIQVQHTWIANDKLVFNNVFTTLQGEFFLDYQDYASCGSSAYNGSSDVSAYKYDANCLWNVQSLNNVTTGVASRSLQSTYQTRRYTYEAKSDGTYFLSNKLGGDHSLKFGVGWKKAPILSFSHYSGNARANVQCVGNTLAGCGNGQYAAAGSASGIVARSAVIYRDRISQNTDWWSYNAYLQDSYSHGKWRLNGGLRFDSQVSKYLGGCVPASTMLPTQLPSQCEDAASVDPVSGREIQTFNNWSPRGAATYDLFGNGKTSIHASGSVYYAQKITLAGALSGLSTVASLTYGTNTSTGLCTGSSCWTDSNLDGVVQTSELSGTPTPGNSRFNQSTGILAPAGNIVDPSAKISRTREGIVGMQHELIPNLAVGVDYIYRKYDQGTATYVIGYQPGAPGFPLANLYVPASYTDPITGQTAPYFQVCPTCTIPSGLGNITVTTLDYQTYNGVDLTATKRYSNRWQMQGALTIQKSPNYFPVGSSTFNNPTGQVFRDGVSTIPKYNLKMNGSYTFKWDIAASANYNYIQGATRTVTVNGPGATFGGVGQSTISQNSLEYQNRDVTRFDPVGLLDLSVSKSFRWAGAGRTIKLVFDGFNVTNSNTITSYNGNNRSTGTFTQPSAIISPRVFRFGTRITF